jgi:membrane protease YdiL (CAAX protease family)
MLLVVPPPPWALLLGLAVPVLWGLAYYGAGLRELRARGGLVATRFFGIPDVLFSIVLASYFAWGGMVSLLRTEISGELKAVHLLANSALMLSLWGGVAFFLMLRRIRLGEALGLGWDRLTPSIFRSIVALGMALPVVWALNTLVRSLVPEQGREQVMVLMFRSAAESGDWRMMGCIGLMGVVVAPWVEETIFRGYFYAVLKGISGPVWSAIVVSGLFAVSHGNGAAMAGLFALALCLTISYERFGSLWVSIGMHACFNAISLALLYCQGRGWLPAG